MDFTKNLWINIVNLVLVGGNKYKKKNEIHHSYRFELIYNYIINL
jgi:hypothetical protein